ncbi:hypothetical protein DPEC_G00058050 [Dallia pectoralis]|uniref:Uncharacterized protein n=1 Tax=Dallia pectoralis TaxID=75939 RepID=A0ACC2H6B9_DALPE|nr:hypothetical protein DPEC_G00058050 [Dallia pectoralis]
MFGSGTRLYVTDQKVQKPRVTIYPASTPEPNGKITLLCLARDMIPDLVKISWKMMGQNGTALVVPQEEGDVLEQTGEGQTTSMIIIDKEKADVNKYICSVKHEGCNNKPDTESFQSMTSLNLSSLTYTVMIVKSLVYCCGLTILIQLRNTGPSFLTLIYNYWTQTSV